MHRIALGRCTILGILVALLLTYNPVASWGQNIAPDGRTLIITINSATRLQMTNRKNIRRIVNPKEGLLNIRTVENDPSMVLLVGIAPGVTRIEMEDAEGNREVREVIVQADVEYLTTQLRKAMPLSGINIIPNGTNSVILTGFVSRAEDIQTAQQVVQSIGFTAINGLRIHGVQQVQLDVVVARVRRTKTRNFGFNFLQNSRRQILGSTIGSVLGPSQGGSGVGTVGVPGTLVQPTQFGQIISSGPGSANLFGGIVGNNSGFMAFLQALESEGVAKLLAQPRLVTLSGNPASFLDGGEQAVPVPAGLGQVGVQFEEFGTRLNFLPIVLGNGRIHLEVEPEVSSLDASAGVAIAGATVAGRATQRIHTTVEMEAGQTFVIGGMIQKASNGSASKVPVLGQLPFLGTAFSTKSHLDDESELVVMVTPHLVDPQSATQVAKVLPGQETRSPDDCELFLEGLLEAPRGPRTMFVNGRYIPPHYTGAGSQLFPCAGKSDGLTKIPHEPIFQGKRKQGSQEWCPPTNVSGGVMTSPVTNSGPMMIPPGAMPEMIPPPGSSPVRMTTPVKSVNTPTEAQRLLQNIPLPPLRIPVGTGDK